MKTEKTFRRMLCLLLLAVLCCSCAVQESIEYRPPLTDQGALYFYLQPLPQEMLPLAFTISDISVVSEQGTPTSLMEGELEISGRALQGIQQRLLSKTLPPGRYKGILLTISRATIAGEDGAMALLPPAQPLHLDLDFTILRGRTQALFLVLSPEYLVTDAINFTPRFVLARPHKHPRNYLGFISNVNDNTVMVFNKRTMEIIQVISTGAAPKGMALDQKNGIVYVTVAGDDAIELISVDSMQIYGRIKLRFGDEPVEAALTPDGQFLIVANYGSGSVSIIDTRSRLETLRLGLEPDPVWVLAGKDGQKAYILHALSNTVSVVDLPNRRLEASISLDDSPWRGALSRDGSTLYVVSPYSIDLQKIDTGTRRTAGKIFTGGNASSVTVDPKNDLVYVGKKTGEVAVADPSAGMFIDSFPVPGDAGFMTIDGEENMLLVVSATRNRVYKFNMVSKREQGSVATEDSPHALVVMGQI